MGQVMAGYKALFCTIEHLETMLSQSETFQTITGSEDADEALERISMMSAADAEAVVDSVDLPRAILWPLGSMQRRSSTSTFQSTVPIVITIEMEIPSNIVKSYDAEFRYVAPLVESIIDELAQMSITRNPGMLNIDEINVVSIPMPCEGDKNQGRRIWDCDIEVIAKG